MLDKQRVIYPQHDQSLQNLAEVHIPVITPYYFLAGKHTKSPSQQFQKCKFGVKFPVFHPLRQRVLQGHFIRVLGISEVCLPKCLGSGSQETPLPRGASWVHAE